MANKKFPDSVFQSPLINFRLEAEAGAEGGRYGISQQQIYWALAALDDGRGALLKNYQANGVTIIDPHPLQLTLAGQALKLLNKEAGHDGAWIIGYTHPPMNLLQVDPDTVWNRLFAIFLDHGGDPQFTWDNLMPAAEQIEEGPVAIAMAGEEAYQRYLKGHKALGLRDDQQFHAAQGQLSPTQRR